jgi:hypothetical protein
MGMTGFLQVNSLSFHLVQKSPVRSTGRRFCGAPCILDVAVFEDAILETSVVERHSLSDESLRTNNWQAKTLWLLHSLVSRLEIISSKPSREK